MYMIPNDVKYSFNQVYYVQADPGNPVNPVAIRPEIFDDHIQWMDTSKGKIVRLERVDNIESFGNTTPDVIKITGKGGEHYTLKKLTLDIYNTNVKSRVMLPPSFNSTEEVQNFYLTADFEPY